MDFVGLLQNNQSFYLHSLALTCLKNKYVNIFYGFVWEFFIYCWSEWTECKIIICFNLAIIVLSTHDIMIAVITWFEHTDIRPNI